MAKTNIFSIAQLLILLFVASSVFAKADISFNGDVQYRLRYHYDMRSNIKGEDSSAAPDFSNRYAWNMKLKINVNKNLFFGVRLSNPKGYATELVTGNSENNYKPVAIPELYFNWKISLLSFSAGIIPVKSNTVLNLVAYEPKGYKDAGVSSWAVKLNNSQTGMNLNLKLLSKDDISLGMNIMATVASDAAGTDKANALVHDQIRLIISIPTKLASKKVSLLPVMHARFNAFRSKEDDVDILDTLSTKVNHTIAGGIDINVKPMDFLGINLGLAGGMYDNTCQTSDYIVNDKNEAVPVKQTAPLGILFNTKITLTPALGKGIVDFNYGRSRDREINPTLNNNLLYWDIKYAFPVKSLTIMPRLRIWHFTNDVTEKKTTKIRPELIFKAAF